MKTKIQLFITVVIFLSFGIYSCEKDATPEEPFKVISITPIDLASNISVSTKIVVTFNKKPSSTTIQGMNFYLSEKLGTDVPCTYTYDGAVTVTCTPKTALNSSEQYKFTVKGATDEDNIKMSSDFISYFTIEKIPFNVISISPLNNATGVKSDTEVVIFFSKKINIDKTMKGILAVSTIGATTSCVVKYNGKDAIALAPKTPLIKNATYSVYLKGVEAADGDILPEFRSEFIVEK